MRRWIRSVSSVVLLALAAPALADVAEDQARALYKQGQTAYDVGEFQKALDLFTDAYKTKALPGFLFNIAQCHRQLQAFERAGFFYGRYLDLADPKASNLELARTLKVEMESRQAAKDAADAKAAADAKLVEEQRAAEELKRAEELKHASEVALAPAYTVPPPPPMPEPEVVTPVTHRWWFWTAIVGGAAAIAGGVTAAVVLTRAPPTLPATTLMDIP
ncbi:MAG: hypothetical protein K1X89_30875 [Myxococcaceae bacterium]|nr:hypothetical protein [Myxococcaceae bacterium]